QQHGLALRAASLGGPGRGHDHVPLRRRPLPDRVHARRRRRARHLRHLLHRAVVVAGHGRDRAALLRAAARPPPGPGRAAMTVVCGIDEAGYGPHLGPLVVAASAFRLQEGARESALHRLVALKDGGGGLPIDDSKRVWSGAHCMPVLETTVLGHVILSRGALPLRVGTLLEGAVDFAAAQVEELPWY